MAVFPLPALPPEEWLGIGSSLPSSLCAHASWVRFPVLGLRSRRLTEPPRPQLRGRKLCSLTVGIDSTETPFPNTAALREKCFCARLGEPACGPGRGLSDRPRRPFGRSSSCNLDAPKRRQVAAALSAAVTTTKLPETASTHRRNQARRTAHAKRQLLFGRSGLSPGVPYPRLLITSFS